MAASTKEDEIKLDIWSFIKNSKATSFASLKRLQSFVLSLDQKQLKHMIQLYLQTTLQRQQIDDLTLEASVNKLKHCINDSSRSNVIHPLDQQILIKLHKSIGKKYDKKISTKLQQKHHDNNNNLLSINPQILASSFQYLSFKELSKILPTCAYFVYIHTSNMAISHYFIELNLTFWRKIFKTRINPEVLRHFKHIRITHGYGDGFKGQHCENTGYLFKNIFKMMIRNSRKLNTLEIDIKRKFNYWLNGFVLRQIMQLIEYPLNVSNLLWIKDEARDVKNSMNSVKNEILVKFPNLTQFVHGLQDGDIQDHVYGLQCARHVILNLNHKLSSINLYCPNINLYNKDYQIIENLTNVKTLQQLNICSLIDGDVTFIETISKNTCLEDLSVEFVINDNETGDPGTSIQRIMDKLFSSFLNISSFNFQHSLKYTTDADTNKELNIDWTTIFDKLFQQKVLYGINNDNVNALSSLEFSLMRLGAMDIVKALRHCYDERYCQIEKIGVKVLYPQTVRITQSAFDDFTNNYLLSFMKLKKNTLNLKSIAIEFGNGFKEHYHRWSEYRVGIRPVKSIAIEPLYMSPIMNILSNLPKSLTECKISIPKYFGNYSNVNSKIKGIETMKIVQKLCEISCTKNVESKNKLKKIILDGIEFSKKAKEFLTFYYGYNNMIDIQNKTYHLYLT